MIGLLIENLSKMLFPMDTLTKLPTTKSLYLRNSDERLRVVLGGDRPWFESTELGDLPRKTLKHHYSHASAGYYTSTFNDAVIVVIDAIGEFNTSTIWIGEGEKIRLKYKENYPVSFGLLYSAFTQLIGLMPNQEEYIMMGMSAYGNWENIIKR
jgi:predicted NodU family carbamoyl transferase